MASWVSIQGVCPCCMDRLESLDKEPGDEIPPFVRQAGHRAPPPAILPPHQDSHEGPGPLTAKATGRKSTVPKPGSMRSPSAGTGRQELAMAPTSKPKDHFFPRVHATARLVAAARRPLLPVQREVPEINEDLDGLRSSRGYGAASGTLKNAGSLADSWGAHAGSLPVESRGRHSRRARRAQRSHE